MFDGIGVAMFALILKKAPILLICIENVLVSVVVVDEMLMISHKTMNRARIICIVIRLK